MSPNDEFADYETWDKGNLDLSEAKQPEMLEFEYARSALRNGLKLEQDLGVNPYKFGMVGSTDAHSGLAAVEEENFFGKTSNTEPSPERGAHTFIKRGEAIIMDWEMAASGYAVVWATENTREALFDAMERRSDALRHDIERLLAALNAAGEGVDAALLGDRFLLGHDFTAAFRSEVARTVGERFAAELSQLEPDGWRRPIASGYGVHLVFVHGRTDGRVPPLEEVREAVRCEWAHARRLATNEHFYRSLRQRYTVTLQTPEQPGGAGAMAAEVQE